MGGRSGSSFPNNGRMGGFQPPGPNYGPTFNPASVGGGSPIGMNGRDMYGRPLAGQPNNGNQMGGGGAASQASTQAFNQWLQSFMQGGGMQQMMQGMGQPAPWNPYMSLINPQGASYRPTQVGNPQGYGGGPNSGTFGPASGTFGPLPPVPTSWKPGDQPWGAPAWRPGMPGGPITDSGIPNPNGGFPTPSTGPFSGPNAPRINPQTGGGISGSMSVDPNSSGLSVDEGQTGQGWETGLGFTPFEVGGSGGLPYGGGNLRPPTGRPNTYPLIPNTSIGNGVGGGGGGGNGMFNEYGMPTGGTDMSGLGGTGGTDMSGLTGNGGFNVGQVGGNYQGAGYNQFSGQRPGDVNGAYNAAQYNQFNGSMPGMVNGENGAWNDPAFLQQLQMGLGGSAQLGDAGSADIDGRFGTAVRDMFARDQMKGTADLRARYGMGGSNGLGSAAAVAEGTYMAEGIPKLAAALGEINVQERGLNLQQRGQDLQNYLGSRGLDNSQLGMMAQNNQFGGDLSLRGQMANQGMQMDWNRLGSQNNQWMNQFNQGESQFGASLGMQGQMANQQNAQNWNQLGSQNNQWMNQFNQNDSQFGAQFGQNAQQMNNQFGLQNQQQMNQYGLGVNSNQLQNQQQMNQYGLGVNSNQLQNQQQMNQYGLGVAGIGIDQQRMQQQQQQFMFQQMMQAYMGQAGWNTPQAENVVKEPWYNSIPAWITAGAGAYGAWNQGRR